LNEKGKAMGIKKHLSADGLHEIVYHNFIREELPQDSNYDISWSDCMMSGLAVFGLKFPSLLKYNDSRSKPVIKGNLRNLYRVKKAPSDTCMRERLDQLSPDKFRRPFKKIFAHLQRSKKLERYRILNGYHLLSVDGTGQFSSQKVHCQHCGEKRNRAGEITYYHHMLGAAIVHPDEKVVIPIAPEPIVKSDGKNKNDCERNASKRLLKDFRREHPHLKTIVIEDALAANYPHLSLLDELELSYIVGVKPGDHQYLFDWIQNLKGEGYTYTKDKVKHQFSYYHDVPLNDTHHDYRVNVIEYWEEKPNGKKQHFTWITKLKITQENVFDLMRSARARWKIENETFNTLKNQGYNFEHNYGHGKNNLCSNFTMLMTLAFLIDQVQWLCCDLFKKLKQKMRTWYSLFEQVRQMFLCVIWDNWEQFYKLLIDPESHVPPNWYGKKILLAD
jgi:hypothetical protein